MRYRGACVAFALIVGALWGQEPSTHSGVDWLVAPVPQKAEVFPVADGRELVMTNGLVLRRWRLAPDAACVALDNLMTGTSILRAVRPEARVTLNGVICDVGGLRGQPNHAYLLPEWLDAMKADPKAFHFIGFDVGRIEKRFAWKRVRHCAPHLGALRAL